MVQKLFALDRLYGPETVYFRQVTVCGSETVL
jgi:hypothetical protein